MDQRLVHLELFKLLEPAGDEQPRLQPHPVEFGLQPSLSQLLLDLLHCCLQPILQSLLQLLQDDWADGLDKEEENILLEQCLELDVQEQVTSQQILKNCCRYLLLFYQYTRHTLLVQFFEDIFCRKINWEILKFAFPYWSVLSHKYWVYIVNAAAPTEGQDDKQPHPGKTFPAKEGREELSILGGRGAIQYPQPTCKNWHLKEMVPSPGTPELQRYFIPRILDYIKVWKKRENVPLVRDFSEFLLGAAFRLENVKINQRCCWRILSAVTERGEWSTPAWN